VILPREEGKAAIDTSPKKIKKTKSLVRAERWSSINYLDLMFGLISSATPHSDQNGK
jgi:hypothetical protein